ncbi:MAG: hypothetical protein ABSB39_06190 [Candidatus Sulfotelmatobacter sp.]|jgi:hypothetical protein
MTFTRLFLSLAMALAISTYLISQAASDQPNDARSYVGKNSCAPELKLAITRYGICLDSSQNAYLMAYRLKAANILTIVQYEKGARSCGVIRDVVQSRDRDSSFVWECRSSSMPSDVIVGTWPTKHPSIKGPAVEAWRINLKALKFEEVQAHVNCEAGNYTGTDEGDSLADWVIERQASKHACTSLEGRHALDEADTLRSWDALYKSYLTFGHCDDGAIGEGYSESVARILTDDWNTLPRFVQLAGKDAAFQAFVIRHLDATLNMDDVQNIKQDAMTHCPTGLRSTCIHLVKQADSALKEAPAP